LAVAVDEVDGAFDVGVRDVGAGALDQAADVPSIVTTYSGPQANIVM
jgi:hypothetical protein